MNRFLPLALAFGAAASLAAQIAPDHAAVVTRMAGNPATVLLDVDPQGGGVWTVGRFGADNLAPLAVAIDPVNRDVLLALDGSGSSLLIRLRLRGQTVIAEQVLALLPGTVSDLVLARSGSILITVDGAAGGVYEIPRNGGTANLVAALPRAAAAHSLAFNFTSGWIVQSGVVGTAPQLSMIDFNTGQPVFGPSAMPGLPLALTGVADLPTAVPRAVVSTATGTLWVVTPFGQPTPVNATPPLGPGAAVAIQLQTVFFDAIVLGGAAHPYLKTTTVFGATPVWRNVAGPLPGNPVDFAMAASASPRIIEFGNACPGPAPHLGAGSGGAPQIGNPNFLLAFRGQANTAVAVLLGSSDQVFGATPLPLALPGGCELLVSPDIVLAVTTDNLGRAQVAIPIPAQPWLAGAIFYGQAFQAGAGVEATPGAAVQVQP